MAAASQSGETQMIELPNGCMCCTIQGEFVDSMLSMLKEREKYDYMIIETTGVADPKPIMASLETSGLSELLFLDQVVSLRGGEWKRGERERERETRRERTGRDERTKKKGDKDPCAAYLCHES